MKKTISILTALIMLAFLIIAPSAKASPNSSIFEVKKMGKYTKDISGVKKFFTDNKAKYKVEDAQTEFSQKSVTNDNLGFRHIKVQQLVNNIPVFGNETIVHYDAAGEIYAVNGNYDPNARNFKKAKDFISSNQAVKIAKSQVSFDASSLNADLADNLVPKLYLYNVNNEYIPVYVVRVNYLYPAPGDWYYFINAYNGNVVNKYNTLNNIAATGTGTGVLGDTKTLNLDKVTVTTKRTTTTQYQLVDNTRAASIITYNCNNGTRIPGSIAYSTTNVVTDKAAVDAHYYAGVVYDYYKSVFNRNGLNNANMAMKSSVHYSRSYNNAFWNGSQMVYGDGDGVTFAPLSGALDVVAHEMSHGVDSNTANLIYQNQSGALNESFSDVFGCFVENRYQPNAFDWLVGEDIYTPKKAGDALRSLANPALYNQPDNMSKYYNTTQDNGGVHTNCGIPNKAAYLIATNGSVGIAKAEQIYYRALTVYLTSSSNFSAARTALAQAAADLYGAGGAEVNAVNSAFSAVGVN
jgi:Zn-dependent metalloprotease